MANAPDFNQIFSKFLAVNSVVIADSSSTSRSYLANLLVKMGAKTSSIGLASSFEDALEEIARVKPKIIICDYDLEKRCGLDLLQEQRKQNPDAKDRLFILVTGNSSQTAVARAAEEDVDTYIIKPFTAETL
ncbi:MAG: response regulator, partial [Bdellovibrionota bacterium]